jgi:Na+/melibiose symporter-like transporter
VFKGTRVQARAIFTFPVAYGFAHFGKSLVWYSSELLFAYFLTEICGLSPVAMGYALALSLAFAGAMDLVVGAFLSRRITTVARAGAWQWPSSLASGAALIVFAATPLAPAAVKVVWVVSSSVAFRFAYALYDVPQNAILGLAEGGSASRIRLSALRFAAAGLASLAVASAATPVLIGGDLQSRIARFLAYAAVLTLVSCATAFNLRRVSADLTRVTFEAGSSTISAPPSHRFAKLLALLVVVAGASAVFGKLEPYYAATALKTSGARTATLFVIAFGGVASQPFWVWLAKRNSRRMAFCVSGVAMALGALTFMQLGGNGAAAAISGLMLASGGGGLAMFLWAALADVVASRREVGEDRPALAFAVVTCTIKLASALAVLMVGQALLTMDYRDAKVATSWPFLTAMAGAPLVAALICCAIPLLLPPRTADL